MKELSTTKITELTTEELDMVSGGIVAVFTPAGRAAAVAGAIGAGLMLHGD